MQELSKQSHLRLGVFVAAVIFFPLLIPDLPACARSPSKEATVSPRDVISDFEARLMLARILSRERETLDEALEHYEKLCREQPENVLLRLEMLRVLLRKGNRQEAAAMLYDLVMEAPEDPETLLALAALEAELGHARACRDLYLRALEVSGQSEGIVLKYADQMNSWGDFYRSEKIFRNFLLDHPADTTVLMKLASVLRSCERYHEAEGIYRKLLLEFPENPEPLQGLARIKRLEFKLDDAADYVDKYLRMRPGNVDGLFLYAEIACLRGQHERAVSIYSTMLAGPSAAEALVGMGRANLEQEKALDAETCFNRALLLDPGNVEARFYLAGPERRNREFHEDILNSKEISVDELEKWARMYFSEGENKEAVGCYQECLDRDPEYFPAWMGLAETLAVDHQYETAEQAFRALNDVFPENRKILVGWARTLAWWKRYRESMDLYNRIHSLCPSDPVPQMEKARTALWGKMMKPALETYGELMDPPVDGELNAGIYPVAQASESAAFRGIASGLAGKVLKGSVYHGYEEFSKNFENLKNDLSAQTQKRADRELVRLLPLYNIQKGAFLEKRAKKLAWNRRFHGAREVYQELAEFAPGNREALFDYAQVQCILGMCNCEARTYRRLLEIDRHHSLARRALRRVEIRRKPFLEAGYSYWGERGREGLTAIDRHRADLAVDVPLDCRFRLKFTGHHWIEQPSYTNKSYEADGFTLAAAGSLTPYLDAEAGWTRKIYRDEIFDDRNTGYGNLTVDLEDYAQLRAGYRKTNELYNYFGMEQGIQADLWELSVHSDVTRKLEVKGTAQYISYSDDNSAYHHFLEAGYALTDHPRMFKVAGFAGRRDTKKQDFYLYQSGKLVDIIHPYWTPRDYYMGGVRFEWHHDLSEFLFCGAEKHRYNLNLTFGTDSEDNSSIELSADWEYDFSDRWSLRVKGLVHRSDLWDAEGLWANLRYRF